MGSDYARLAGGRVGLLRLQRGAPNAPRLLCFPHAGGSARSFAALANCLPQGFGVHAIDPPGRIGTAGEPLATVEELVALYRDALPDELEGAYLVGHSLGGYVALALAQLLAGRARGLAILATTPPHVKAVAPGSLELDDAQLQAWAEALGFDRLRQLPLEIRSVALRALRADLTAFQLFRWRGARALGMPVLLCGGQSDRFCSSGVFARWRELVSGKLCFSSGGHFFVQSNAHELATLLRDFAR
jgi:pyochelin biosynthesis protein PchC